MKRSWRQRGTVTATTAILLTLCSWTAGPSPIVAQESLFFGSGHTPIATTTDRSEFLFDSESPQENAAEDQAGEWCPDCGCSYGTLFQWSNGNSYGGGPDLDAPLVTDRPDFTEASSTVGLGVTQIEAGYTYTYNADGGTSVRRQSFGEPLFRHGFLANWLELRVGIFPAQERTTAAGRSNSTAGIADLYLGFKIGLTPQECLLPEMALIPQMTVPSGSGGLTDEEVLPGVNWIYSWEITDRISTAGSTQINRRVDGTTGRAYSEIAQSWTVAASLTETLGSYLEWFVLAPHSADTALTQHYLNGGFTYLVNNDVQLDIRGGYGLNGAADDYFFGTGITVRLK